RALLFPACQVVRGSRQPGALSDLPAKGQGRRLQRAVGREDRPLFCSGPERSGDARSSYSQVPRRHATLNRSRSARPPRNVRLRLLQCNRHGAPFPPRAGTAAAYQHGIYLVFPFENAGASPRLDWLGEGLEELTIQRLSGAGEQVYSHAGRLVELERYGLPRSSKLSRATML